MTRTLRRGIAALGLVALLAAACTAQTPGDGRPAARGPAADAPRDGSGADVRACPRVVDAAARLSYDCIDESFVEIPPETAEPSFAAGSIRMAAYTEPSWLAAQQSGALTAASTTAQYTALLLAAQQISDNYGPGAASSTQGGVDEDDLGISAYRLDILVTLDPAYVQANGLAVRTELLCIVVVQLSDDRYSAMTISVPDTRRSLWADYDRIVASLATV